MADSEEALQLKRRARRRLLGAIALVVFVVIILPLVLDKEPGPAGTPLSVQIPSQEAGGFNTQVVPLTSEVPAAPAVEKKAETAAAKAETDAARAKPHPGNAPPPAGNTQSVAPPVHVAPPVKTEAARMPAATGDQAWVFSLDAFSDKKNVTQLRSRLTAAGVKSYTESVKTGKGDLTRVRAGPFASKEAAEKARSRLVAMGLKPGAVVSR